MAEAEQGTNRELLLFEMYTKSDIQQYIDGNIESLLPADSVQVHVNPKQIEFAQPRVIQKIQTQTFQRFVVQDWGPDLMTLTISGQTGKLLPDNVVSKTVEKGVFKKRKETVQVKAGQVGVTLANLQRLRSLAEAGKGNVELVQEGPPEEKKKSFLGRLTAQPREVDTPYSVLQSLKYSDVIRSSVAYQTFLSLFLLYRNFSATSQIMILNFMKFRFRGYFSDFNYTQAAEKPWNWEYRATYVVLADLTNLDIVRDNPLGSPEGEHNKKAIIDAEAGRLAQEKNLLDRLLFNLFNRSDDKT